MFHWAYPIALREVRPGVALSYESWLLYHYRVLLPVFSTEMLA